VSSSGSPVPANELGSLCCARAGRTLQLDSSSVVSPSQPLLELSRAPELESSVASPSQPPLDSDAGSGSSLLLQPSSSSVSSDDSLPQPPPVVVSS
jgi:hypothetical protein